MANSKVDTMSELYDLEGYRYGAKDRPKMKDRFGTEARVGDVIAYVGRKSSSVYLHRGTINKIDEKGLHITRDLTVEPNYSFQTYKKKTSILSSPTFVVLNHG